MNDPIEYEEIEALEYYFLHQEPEGERAYKIIFINAGKFEQIQYCVNRQAHKTDGPEIIWANGSKLWYQNGKLHRIDGPAIDLSDGHKEWYLNGVRHREDGPAVELPNGVKCYYLNGKKFEKSEFPFEIAKAIERAMEPQKESKETEVKKTFGKTL